jgi:hypothetical protein
MFFSYEYLEPQRRKERKEGKFVLTTKTQRHKEGQNLWNQG